MRKSYSAGDLIYLGRLENGKVAVLPVYLVTLVSISVDGELWTVRSSESGDLYDHFIQYSDEEDETDREETTSNDADNRQNELLA